MVNSNSESTHVNKDHDDEQSKSSMIVKIKPRARVRVKKRERHVRIKKTPSPKQEKRTNISESKPFPSQDSINDVSLLNDLTSIDENILEENDVAEIISLLERARSRSHGTEENEEDIPEPTQQSRVVINKKTRKKKYY